MDGSKFSETGVKIYQSSRRPVQKFLNVNCDQNTYYFSLFEILKNNFPPTTSGLAEIAVNFSDSEMYLFVKLFTESPFLKVGCAL